MFNRCKSIYVPLIALLVFSVGLMISQNSYAATGKPQLHHVPSSNCGSCHNKIFKQWSGSMHANSTALKDPIHGSFYKMLMGSPTQEDLKTKQGKFPLCLQCHAPNAARDKKTKLDAMPAYSEGINCVACHTMKKAKGPIANSQLGAKAYEYSDSALQGPNGSFSGNKPVQAPGGSGSVVNPFPHEARSDLFRSSDLCLGCHETRNNGNGVPVCATGPEMVKSGNTVTCQSCHMPVVNGVVDHSMAGGHHPAMVRRGVIFAVQAQNNPNGAQATVNIKNTLGHNLPTGAPFRNMFIKVTALDAQGLPVWSNYKKSPFKEDKKSVMMLLLVGKDGKPTSPAKASGIGKDTRLKPGESRDIVYDIPVKGAVKIRAELYYDLLLPPFKKKFAKTIPAALRKSSLISIAEATL
ncbi:MAG: cytochrome c family protein [Magnetococcales bacterium]|nr:cytochrome c family protein [Magnetococcales bacterium]